MKEKTMLYGVIGFLLGVVLTMLLTVNAVNTNNTGMMRMMGMRQQMMKDEDMMMEHEGTSMGMDEMVKELEGLQGDEFDKTFINLMIDHHQGAIDMAKLAKQNAKHDEIKNLGDDIISAQTKEINEMREWYKSWGY